MGNENFRYLVVSPLFPPLDLFYFIHNIIGVKFQSLREEASDLGAGLSCSAERQPRGEEINAGVFKGFIRGAGGGALRPI